MKKWKMAVQLLREEIGLMLTLCNFYFSVQYSFSHQLVFIELILFAVLVEVHDKYYDQCMAIVIRYLTIASVSTFGWSKEHKRRAM